MAYNTTLTAQKLNSWHDFAKSFSLPSWDKLPPIDLYMDQVIVLLNDYLSYLSYDGSEEKLITPSMINNYVKLGLMPAPHKKQYGKMHIAMLIMIIHYKQVHSMATIRKILPRHDTEEVHRAYDKFVLLESSISKSFASQIKEQASAVFDENTAAPEKIEELVSAAALYSISAKLLSAQIITLKDSED